MHSIDLILILTAGLGAVLALGYATHRLGLSPNTDRGQAVSTPILLVQRSLVSGHELLTP